jgi:phospholipid N-methyltransferase
MKVRSFMFDIPEEYYPTPKTLIHKMLQDVDFCSVRAVLEPSAGTGNIVEEVLNKFESLHRGSFYSREKKKYDIDCIEQDQNFRYILQGKGFRVVHDDFLTYDSYKKYDLVIMNPPFSNGDKHILKALELIRQGGTLVAIINSETIKNPYSNSRKDLVRKLKELNATIEYLQEEFIDADRTTSVEIAMIKLTLEKNNKESLILEQLKQEEQYRNENKYNTNTLINGDFIQGIIEQYNFEVKAGLNLINEYENLKPYILSDFKEEKYSGSILCLSVGSSNNRNDNSNDTLVNAYIKKVRYKYWNALFNNPQFTSLLTTNLLYEYRDKVTELQDYDFSYYNIKEIQTQMSKNLIKGVEDTILNLFEEFSHKHSWYAEMSSNIHYFDGWKTNKSYKVNNRIILVLSGYSSVWDRLDYSYKFYEKLKDIERIFDYLDGGKTEESDLKQILDEAQKQGQTKKITTKYFSLNVFKKGTTHITFLDEELLKKFNIFGSQKRGWLPPTYGKSKYNDMSKEEQEIINNFEGEKSYNETMKNTEYYLYNPNKVLMING